MKTIITIKTECPMQARTLIGILLQDLINYPIKDKDVEKGGFTNDYKEKYGTLQIDIDPENELKPRFPYED